MRRQTIFALLVAASSGASIAACGPGEPPAPSPGPYRTGRDPAVQRIDFEVLNRTSPLTARVRITGVVANLGRLAYESGPDQQNILLYENRRHVQTVRFQNLGPGEEVRIQYERDWDVSSPAEGEFPPTYHVFIDYDADIYLDSNPANDDEEMNNNRRQREGNAINDLVRG
jgi:hypothetical protein